jgi:hypothetical protein
MAGGGHDIKRVFIIGVGKVVVVDRKHRVGLLHEGDSTHVVSVVIVGDFGPGGELILDDVVPLRIVKELSQ